MINYLPADMLRGLNCTQVKATYHLLSMIQWHGKKSLSGAAYWNAGQKSMALTLGVSRTWLSTCIQQLHNQQILTKLRRRREKGQWKTNLYKLGPRIVKIFKGPRAALQALAYHVSSSRHTVSKPVSKLNKEGIRGGFQPYGKAADPIDLTYLASLKDKYGPGGTFKD